VGKPSLQELIRILCHFVKCPLGHNIKYNTLNNLYLAVQEELYVLYAPLILTEDWYPVYDANGVQEHRAIPDTTEYLGQGPLFPGWSLDNSPPAGRITMRNNNHEIHIINKERNRLITSARQHHIYRPQQSICRRKTEQKNQELPQPTILSASQLIQIQHHTLNVRPT